MLCLLQTVISLQPRVAAAAGESAESKVLAIASDMELSLPELFDLEEVHTVMTTRSDPDPLKTVVFQEVERYNKLLSRIKKTLVDLQKGVKGLVVITTELYVAGGCMSAGRGCRYLEAAAGIGHPGYKICVGICVLLLWVGVSWRCWHCSAGLRCLTFPRLLAIAFMQ